jgi:hypothetical protein
MLNKSNTLIIGSQVPVAIVLIVLYFLRNIEFMMLDSLHVVDVYPFGGATFVVTVVVGFVLAVVSIYQGFTAKYVVEKTRNFYVGLLVINTVIIVDFIVKGIKFADFSSLLLAELITIGYVAFLTFYKKTVSID